MRVAAVDCGTNTVRLLVAERPEQAEQTEQSDGRLEVLVREERTVRLGEGVDRTGRLAEAALGRAFGALDAFAALLDEHRVAVASRRVCATSATRDAANRDVFVDGVRERLGVTPEVVDGAEEGALAFAGVVGHLGDRLPGRRLLVVDVGGGSTELALGEPVPGARPQVCSMDVGSVRLHERHVRGDPPGADEIEACVADVRAALAACPWPLAEVDHVVGVAGTAATVGAAVLDLPGLDESALDGATLSTADVLAAVDRFAASTVARRRALPFMRAGREDVVVAGGLVLATVLRATGASELVVSAADVLDGIAWSIGDPAGAGYRRATPPEETP